MSLLGFPNPVNEKAARVVAGGVAVETIAVLTLAIASDRRWLWLTAVLVAGFAARVLTGPTLSPLGRLATAVIAPRLGAARPVPGPPKRFAQCVGFVFSAAVLGLTAAGATTPALLVLGVLLVFALLESLGGFCAGCLVFGWLMRAGIVPESVCEECADVSRRWAAAA